jgi:hypothetical protein
MSLVIEAEGSALLFVCPALYANLSRVCLFAVLTIQFGKIDIDVLLDPQSTHFAIGFSSKWSRSERFPCKNFVLLCYLISILHVQLLSH